MNEQEWLAQQFEDHRDHLRGVAYRMLGSVSEAEDAVQEGWLRLSRSADRNSIGNLGGWLTTVVARVCLDMLRARKARAEETTEEPLPTRGAARDAEQETLLADAVGLAMMVVLERLEPAERLAFVLHDMFAMSFEDIAEIVDRSPMAARQLASRARRRVQGGEAKRDVARQREVVDAFLSAARRGDFEGLLAVLDPNLVARSDRFVPGGAMETREAALVAERAMKGGARAARPAWIDGDIGVVIAPRGRLMLVLRFTIEDGRIAAIDTIGDPARLRQLDIRVLEN